MRVYCLSALWKADDFNPANRRQRAAGSLNAVSQSDEDDLDAW